MEGSNEEAALMSKDSDYHLGNTKQALISKTILMINLGSTKQEGTKTLDTITC